MTRPLLLLVVVGSLAIGVRAECENAAPNPPVTLRLRRFVADVAALEDSTARDRQIWLAFAHLSWRIRDNELGDVEAFSLLPEAKSVRWILAGLLIQRNHFGGAAAAIVRDLAETESAASFDYRVWKWWDYHFRDREDHDKLSLQMAEAFVSQFAHGTAKEKAIILAIFTVEGSAEMTSNDLRKAIGLPGR